MKRVLSLGGALARVLAWLLNRWPLLLVAAFFYLDEGPHLRVAGTYQGSRDYPRYISCTYLGSRGFVPGYMPGCPLIVWMNAREGE
ncbi:MAG: hypothetical protein HQ481_05645 [Alphaproteobacteria bacterium]|nr:hypothetical protein [Alphaproteobacteria bacterium]